MHPTTASGDRPDPPMHGSNGVVESQDVQQSSTLLRVRIRQIEIEVQ